MKPILIGSTPDGNTEPERVARFGGREAGGRTINTAIMANFKGAEIQHKLQLCRDAGQVALVWFYPDHSTINAPGFHPNQIPGHPDTLALLALLDEHCAAGGVFVASVLDEMEQYAKWGPKVYRDNFDAIASRFPAGGFASWDKGPNPAPAKYGGPLKFADWRPSLAAFRGVHLFSDCVDPLSARGYDVLRWEHETHDLGLLTSMLSGGFSMGNILDPVQAKTWVKRFLALALSDTFDVRICASPMSQDFSGFPGLAGKAADGTVIPACNGRYAPGAHQPPGDVHSAPWPGSPEMCAVLDKAYAIPGQWLYAGDVDLEAFVASVGAQPAP